MVGDYLRVSGKETVEIGGLVMGLKVGQKVHIKKTKETGYIRSVLICGDIVVVLDKSDLAKRVGPEEVTVR